MSKKCNAVNHIFVAHNIYAALEWGKLGIFEKAYTTFYDFYSSIFKMRRIYPLAVLIPTATAL